LQSCTPHYAANWLLQLPGHRGNFGVRRGSTSYPFLWRSVVDRLALSPATSSPLVSERDLLPVFLVSGRNSPGTRLHKVSLRQVMQKSRRSSNASCPCPSLPPS